MYCLPPHPLPHNKGTNQYEPVEVREQRYLFMEYEDDGESDEDDEDDEDDENDKDDEEDEMDEEDEENEKNEKDEKDENDHANDGSRPPFKFNCIHDLESVWWIALWVLFLHVPLGDDKDRSAQILKAAELFPSVGGSSSRVTAFTGGIQDFLQLLAPAFQPSARRLIEARALLVRRYRRAEKGSSINETAFDGIHKNLRAIWRKARIESKGINYAFVLPAKHGATEEPPDLPGLSKRPKIT
jgi:hypothetical protein